jgi:AcrR family transcriptional regulator
MTTAERFAAQYADSRREEILDAATRIIARRGMDGATMQQIASETGLSVGALYRYYAGKSDLVRAVLERCESDHEALFGEVGSDASPLTTLMGIGEAEWAHFHEADAREHFAMNLELALAAYRDPDGVGEDLDRFQTDLVESLRQLVEAAQASGELRTDIEATPLAYLMLALVMGTGLQVVQTPRTIDTDGIWEAFRALIGMAGTSEEDDA